MNPKKNLILLCDSYPISSGEFFIDDEMKVIHTHFDKIFVLIKEQEQKQLNRFIPDNLEIITYNSNISKRHKLKAIPKIFSSFFISELFRSIFKFKIKPTPLFFKIIFMDIVHSNIIIEELKKVIGSKKIEVDNTVLYSYWHDYKALALARLSIRSEIKTIARAHGWDVFADRHNPPYLPFKKFIIGNLTATFSISDAGQTALLKYTENINKIKVSKLGKINNRKPLFNKIIPSYTICSCSNIIPLKRINKIIDLLSALKIDDIKWIHFGAGYLMKDIILYAKEKLQNIDFKLIY